jgi:anti-sigma factor RsiW
MTEHVSNQLSPYLDDELEPSARAQVDAHLRACEACSTELETLRRILAHAATIADEDTPPSRDLWSGIAARIEQPRTAPAALTNVVPSSEVAARRASARTATASAPRRVSLSISQLAAAAALLIALSGATAWFVRGSATAPAQTVAGSGVIQAEIEPRATDGVRLANFADAQYDAAVSDLERTLSERRNDLNPRTVEILERNLKLIDAAIAQARQALEEDPGNQYLNRHLVESRHRKLELLRRATAITEGD